MRYPWYLNLISEGDKPVKFLLHGLLAFINFLLQAGPVLCTDKTGIVILVLNFALYVSLVWRIHAGLTTLT